MSRAIERPYQRRVSRTGLREWGLFLALVAPNVLLLAAFTYWPLIYNGYLSLTEWDMISPEKSFVGLANYGELLREPRFWRIFLNTLYFVIGSVGITMAVALGAALLLNQRLHGRGLARAVVFTPTVLTGSAIAIVWIYILDPNYGLCRVFLNAIGLASPKWLTDLFWAMPALLIIYVWKNFGYAVVVYLAGLQGIPRELYEAAIVDGASPWDRFRHVTWPGLGSIIFNSTASLAGIEANSKFAVGTGFLPKGPAGFGCCTGGSGLALMQSSTEDKRAAAFEYVKFATSPEHTAWWSQNTGYMPVRKSAIDGREMNEFYKQKPNVTTAVKQVPMTKPQDWARVGIPNGDQMIGKGLERVTVAQEPVEQVFKDLQAQLEKEGKPIVEQFKKLPAG